jgi:hypothetical protein
MAIINQGWLRSQIATLNDLAATGFEAQFATSNESAHPAKK